MTGEILSQHTLVLGGARSGKSRFAEELTLKSGKDRIYLATAQAFDNEMEQRVARHKSDRGDDWVTIEESMDLVGALKGNVSGNRIVLVDCLTLWLSNLMGNSADISAETDQLITCLPNLTGQVVFVSNEVGQGIVPENKMAREFRDHAGLLHQRLAETVNSVYFVTAGIAQKLK
jgi:adenosylcobinamide kinase/adenosylcobinamide-phosphate guanylyltransferase